VRPGEIATPGTIPEGGTTVAAGSIPEGGATGVPGNVPEGGVENAAGERPAGPEVRIGTPRPGTAGGDTGETGGVGRVSGIGLLPGEIIGAVPTALGWMYWAEPGGKLPVLPNFTVGIFPLITASRWAEEIENVGQGAFFICGVGNAGKVLGVVAIVFSLFTIRVFPHQCSFYLRIKQHCKVRLQEYT
jgi:hypothetical protein